MATFLAAILLMVRNTKVESPLEGLETSFEDSEKSKLNLAGYPNSNLNKENLLFTNGICHFPWLDLVTEWPPLGHIGARMQWF